MNGVDISHYQHGLTIQQLKDAGKTFAIIKLTEGNYLKDGSAFDFYLQAYNSGFPVGGYCYSHAMNPQQALAEAAFLVEMIRKFPFPCGLFLDMEEETQLALPHDELLNIIRAWYAGITGAGYIPGIYSSAGTLWSKVSPDELPDGTLVWVAKWSNTQPDIRCDVWQNSDSGKIEGYSGNVDTDVAMSDRFKIMVTYGKYKPDEEKKEEHRATDAGEKAVILILQMLMCYTGHWGEVTGEKSKEFFDALHSFVDALEKGV